MPRSNTTDDIESLWQTITNLGGLWRLRDSASASIASHKLSQHIQGFQLIIDEIENDACNWVSAKDSIQIILMSF